MLQNFIEIMTVAGQVRWGIKGKLVDASQLIHFFRPAKDIDLFYNIPFWWFPA